MATHFPLWMSTTMAAPPGTPQVERSVSGAPLLIRYNSRLPVAIYTPKGHETRYRIWQAPETTEKAEKG